MKTSTQTYTFSAIAMLCCLLGCRPVRDVGSACPGGVCAQSSQIAGVPCLIRGGATTIHFDGTTSDCLARPLSVDAHGKVNCSMDWVIPEGGPSRCAEFGLQANETDAGVRCEVPQLERPGASAETPMGRGWYYDEHSPETLEACDDGTDLPGRRFVVTEGLIPAEASVYVRCAEALASTEDVPSTIDDTDEVVAVDVTSCKAPTSTSAVGVGDPCLPQVEPPGGFFVGDYVQTGAGDCQTGVCLVARTVCESNCESMDDAGLCATTRCTSLDDLSQRAYCSCRCDDGEGKGCDCPDGFACVQAVGSVSPYFDGSYCADLSVRDGATAPTP